MVCNLSRQSFYIACSRTGNYFLAHRLQRVSFLLCIRMNLYLFVSFILSVSVIITDQSGRRETSVCLSFMNELLTNGRKNIII